MKLSLFNSLTKKTEIFEPLNSKNVKMYVCGPTVYDRAHIGNARSAVAYDLLYRILIKIYGFDSVLYTRNITDIDDKIINKSKDTGQSIYDITKETHKYFNDDMEYLNCISPNVEPKATEHIEEMIQIIEKLLKDGYAYKASDHVFYDISKFDNYYNLSNRDLDNASSSEGNEISSIKKNDGDFVLWKPAKAEDPEGANFDSPFGYGRPGWHIECSAMSNKYLGPDFDIHGGGIDLIFPHHTNEIAQSCAAFKDSKYAKYWIHNGFLTIKGSKMSKSLGNFKTVYDFKQSDVSGPALRLFLLSVHYRRPLDYNEKAMKDVENMIAYWKRCLILSGASSIGGNNIQLPSAFMSALLDDLNISEALKEINAIAKSINTIYNVDKKLERGLILLNCINFIGIDLYNGRFKNHVTDEEVEDLIIDLKSLKSLQDRKEWEQADKVRQTLSKKKLTQVGVIGKDLPLWFVE